MAVETVNETAANSEPHLIALLFAEWASETQERKHAFGGVFDRVQIVSGTSLPFTFFLYIRTMQARSGQIPDPIQVDILAPDGNNIGSVFMEAIEPEDAIPQFYPLIVQGISRVTMTLDQIGIYWFKVMHHGQSLGMAPLIVGDTTVTANNEESGDSQREQRHNQIEVLAMKGPKKPKSKDSWLKTVGKYSEGSPLNRIFDEGAKIREAERIEQC